MSYRRILPAAVLAAVCLTGCAKPEPQEYSTDLFAMDTYMQLKVWNTDDGASLDAAAARIAALENTFSVTIDGSDIARVNHAAGAATQVSEDTALLIRKAQEIGDASGGALDISLYPVLCAWGFTTGEMHVPDPETLDTLLGRVDYTKIGLDGNTVTLPADMEIDLGALAKGYTSDEVIRIFRESGAESAIVSLGGNVQALGSKPDGSKWKVGIVDPFSPSENMGVVEIENQAVITSGNYERYFEENGQKYWHILDKADVEPADNGLVSMTIIGDSGLQCDALSTALFVEGTEGAVAHWQRDGGFEMLLVTEDGRMLVTEGIADAFTNRSAMPMEVISHE